MAKHSFISREGNFQGNPQRVSRFLPDHEEPEIGEMRYAYTYGPLKFQMKKPLSHKFALASFILMIVSFILWSQGHTFREPSLKYSLAISVAFFCNFFMIKYSENTPKRELKNIGRVKKNRLGLTSILGFTGFAFIVGGLTSYPGSGIFGGIFAFFGSVMTLVSFVMLNYAERSERRLGKRELLMVLMFLPAAIGFFTFFGIIMAFFAQFH